MKKMTPLSSLLDFLFPRYCPNCGTRLDWDEDVMCLMCNINLPRTDFWKSPYDNSVARLFWGKILVEKAVSYYYFSPKTGDTQLIYDIKYHNDPGLAKRIGIMIAEEVKEYGFFDGIDCIVPLPLSIKREIKRGYNQCEMLAKGISRVTGIPVLPYVVLRRDFKGSQTHLSAWERINNVTGVFQLMDAEEIRGRHVLLVDDVITTGATTLSCAEELVKAGDVKISVLSIAFAGKKEVVRQEESDATGE